jgi:hypothetical protein
MQQENCWICNIKFLALAATLAQKPGARQSPTATRRRLRRLLALSCRQSKMNFGDWK